MPISLAPDWAGWRNSIQASNTMDDLHLTLRNVATEVAAYAGRNEVSHAQWKRLGVHVAPTRMSASGGCRRDGGELVVLVNQSDDPRRQRFTVAHEIGHLLLDDARGRVAMSLTEEEHLCNVFASHVIVPRGELQRVFDTLPGDCTASKVIELCQQFGTNLQAMLLALSEFLLATQTVFLAKRIGHSKRRDVVAYRIAASSETSIFLPREQRIASIGFVSLNAWAEAADEVRGVGQDEVRLELRRKALPGWGSASGSVAWSAHRLSEQRLLASVTADEVEIEWGSQPRAAAVAA